MHAATMRKIMTMSSMVRKDNVGPLQSTNHSHCIGFLADAGVGSSRQTAFTEFVKHALLEQSNAQHLLY
jgi:hypothetical protein